MLARLFSLLLLVLTRDGVLHRLEGDKHSTEPAPHATSFAPLPGGRVALLGDGRITVVDGRRRRTLPAHGARALAGGNALWALVPGGVARVDFRSGADTLVWAEPRAHLLAADGDDAFAELDGVVTQVGTDRHWKVPGHPIALAAGDDKLYLATKEGPLWEVDRASGGERNLGLGDWWGTLGLAAGDRQLFAVTVSGKLWRIDPAARQKTIIAMDGWQFALGLSVLR